MTTREDLHRLVDRIPPEALDDVALALRQYLPAGPGEPPYPRSVGILAEAPADSSASGTLGRRDRPASLGLGRSGRGDVSERAEELLDEDGFGR